MQQAHQQQLRQSQAGLMSTGGVLGVSTGGGVMGGVTTGNDHHTMQGLAGGRKPLLGNLKLQLYEYKPGGYLEDLGTMMTSLVHPQRMDECRTCA
jgi:hypothetical protein